MFNLEKSELKQIIPDPHALGWERQQEGTEDVVTWKMSPGKCPHPGERQHESHRARARDAGTGTKKEKESSKKNR